MAQMTYARATGNKKRWCNRHRRFRCSCGRPQKDYSHIDYAITRVLDIYASPEKPMPPRRIQRMIKHFNIYRSERSLYEDLVRLEKAGKVSRLSCRSGFYLR